MTGALLILALLGAPPTPGFGPIDGIALSPHYENPAEGLTFDQMIDEIAATGASHVSIVVQWGQVDARATEIGPHPKETQPDDVVRRMIRRAHGRGLRVLLFPILWVEARAIGEWRGTLQPADRAAWWASYRAFILHYARMAAEERVEQYSVGSELAAMEGETAAWRALIAAVRAVYRGQLLYSANWDHYAEVQFWDALDYVGLTGYYRLAEGTAPTRAELLAAWGKVRLLLLDWLEAIDRPLIFTEVGYPSLDGAARAPWDYTGDRDVDLAEQAECLAAFSETWVDEPRLAGVFFWNWWGPGGPTDRWYTLKGKPALDVVRRWIQRRTKVGRPATDDLRSPM